MNIVDKIKFSPEKPGILRIHKGAHINLIAIGLLKKQMLKKHQTAIPTLLTVLSGNLEFRIENKKMRLTEFDTIQIPANTEHEVEGLAEKNVFCSQYLQCLLYP